MERATQSPATPADTFDAYMAQVSSVPLLTAAQERALAERIVALRVDYWRAIFRHAPFVDVIACFVVLRLPDDQTIELCGRVIDAAAARRASDRKARREDLASATYALAIHLAMRDYENQIANQIGAEIGALLDVKRDVIHWPNYRVSKPLTDYMGSVASSGRAYTRERNRFARANLRLVVRIAGYFRSSGMTFDDLVQEGNIGLLKSVDRFDPARGFRFSTYACWWIRHYIRRAIVNRGRTIRLPQHLHTLAGRVARTRREFLRKHGHDATTLEVADLLGVQERKVEEIECILSIGQPASLDTGVFVKDDDTSLFDTLGNSDPHPDGVIDGRVLAVRVRDAIGGLPENQQDIIRKRFGIDGDPQTLQEIGEQHGLSRERVRQLQIIALGRLREGMGEV